MSTSNEQFLALLDEFCRLCNVPDPAAVRETGAVLVDDIPFTLVYNEKLNVDEMYILCELGPLGKADEKECYQRMLHMNYLMSYRADPIMALDPRTNAVMMISRLPFDGMTAELLRTAVGATAKVAHDWRDGKMFDEAAEFFGGWKEE
ncbi:MAG TPA: CesT family type III secretion system chaperone [Burkholderiales bacterium]|nr:CesT family type III secretion system chaperone [Burkholderiales bacterium]